MHSIFNISRAKPHQISHEKKIAQTLKKSAWWKNQIAKNKCYYCKQNYHPNQLTMDHKISLIRGGKSTKKNVVPCCECCNKKKKYLFYGEVERL